MRSGFVPRATTSMSRATILAPGAPYTIVVVVTVRAVWTSVEVVTAVVVCRMVLQAVNTEVW